MSIIHPTPLLSVSSPEAESEHARGEPLDLIHIEGFTGETVIGIHETELHRPQPLVIDVHAGVPRALACSTDRIGDTIDYGVLRNRLRTLLAEHRLQLLEALAQTIADIVLDEFGARWVRVKVVKPKKFADVDAVGVTIERHAGVKSQAQPSARLAPVLHLIGEGHVPK